MKKYLLELNLHLQRHLMYRSRVLIWFITDTVQVILLPFLWLSIYGDRQSVEGFSRADIVTYYVLILVVGLLARSHLRRIVQSDIIRGDLNVMLLRPINYLILRPMRELSYKVLLSSLSIPVVAAVFFLFPQYIVVPSHIITWLFVFIAIALGYMLSFLMEMCIGLLSIWMGETKSVEALKNIAFYILSGELAPLAFLPPVIQSIAHYSPFRFILSTPVEIFLGQKDSAKIMTDMFGAIMWIIALGTLMTIIWKKGIRKYEGVGI